MAQNDFVIRRQSVPPRWAHQTASAVFDEGDVVVLTAGGRLAEAATNPASVDGIAAMNSRLYDGSQASGALSPNAQAVGEPITFHTTDRQNEWVTTQFSTTDNTTLAVPTIANVGDTAGLNLDTGQWFVDTSQGNHVVEIVDVLNAAGQSLDTPQLLDTTGTQVVFRFTL